MATRSIGPGAGQGAVPPRGGQVRLDQPVRHVYPALPGDRGGGGGGGLEAPAQRRVPAGAQAAAADEDGHLPAAATDLPAGPVLPEPGQVDRHRRPH